MSTVEEFLKWFEVKGYDVVARGERVGTCAGVTREPPEGRAVLVDLDGGRRIALPFELVAGVDGAREALLLVVRPGALRETPAYDPAREAPDEGYLARVRGYLRRAGG